MARYISTNGFAAKLHRDHDPDSDDRQGHPANLADVKAQDADCREQEDARHGVGRPAYDHIQKPLHARTNGGGDRHIEEFERCPVDRMAKRLIGAARQNHSPERTREYENA